MNFRINILLKPALMVLLFVVCQVTYANNTPASKSKKKETVKKEVVKKVNYKAHVFTAVGHGLAPIKNTKQLNSYVSKKKLSATKCTKGCTINKLSYSQPYMVPKANKVLNEIAKSFHTKTKSSFTVTSITRTLADQHRLRQVNSNATHGLSAHNFGASYDISYIRFNGKKGPNPKLEKALENILIQFQKQGKIYYIKEKWQSCFHVTVRS